MNTPKTRQKTILIIEDDAEVRNILTLLFESSGYLVYAAATGGEGYALSEHLKPQVITLDLCLPDADGLDILRSLKANRATRNIPIIVISASIDLMSRADQKCVFGVIRKPFDLDAVEAAAASAALGKASVCLSLPHAS